MVMAGGVPYTVDELLAPFVSASPHADVSPMLPAVPDAPANERYWWHDPHYIEVGRRSCCVMA